MSALLLKLSPYLAAVIVVFGGGWYAGGLQPKAALARLQAANWQTQAEEETIVVKALQGQLEKAQTVAANNAQAVEKLNAENAQIAADRDDTLTRVRRLEQLLVVASRPATPSAAMSQAGGGQGTPGASGDPVPTEIERLLIDAKDEAQRNAARLNALIAQIEPQL
jgi:hypothetical protein